MKLIKEYGRYNQKGSLKYPYEYKRGVFGKVHKSNTLGLSLTKARQLRNNPNKWYVIG